MASRFEAEFVALTGDGVGLAVQFPKSKRVLTPEAEADERHVAAAGGAPDAADTSV